MNAHSQSKLSTTWNIGPFLCLLSHYLGDCTPIGHSPYLLSIPPRLYRADDAPPLLLSCCHFFRPRAPSSHPPSPRRGDGSVLSDTTCSDTNQRNSLNPLFEDKDVRNSGTTTAPTHHEQWPLGKIIEAKQRVEPSGEKESKVASCFVATAVGTDFSGSGAPTADSDVTAVATTPAALGTIECSASSTSAASPFWATSSSPMFFPEDVLAGAAGKSANSSSCDKESQASSNKAGQRVSLHAAAEAAATAAASTAATVARKGITFLRSGSTVLDDEVSEVVPGGAETPLNHAPGGKTIEAASKTASAPPPLAESTRSKGGGGGGGDGPVVIRKLNRVAPAHGSTATAPDSLSTRQGECRRQQRVCFT